MWLAETTKKMLTENNGYWEYKAPGKYLALLTSGKYSDVFLNTGVITSRVDLLNSLNIMSGDCFRTLSKHKKVAFAGPALGAVSWTQYLATAHYKMYGPTDSWILFAEKVQNEFSFRLFPDQVDCIYLCEDVITTGLSLTKMLVAIKTQLTEKHQPLDCIKPFVYCLVNRSGLSEMILHPDLPPFRIISCVTVQAQTFDTIEQAQTIYPNVIEGLRPKTNWKKLLNG